MSKITLPAVDISLAEFRNRDHCISYEFLQKMLRLQMIEIDKILHAYYAANDIFPGEDKSQIFKWTIMRKKNTSQVEVYFSEQYENNNKEHREKVSRNGKNMKQKKATKTLMPAPVPPAGGQPGSGGDVASPDVLTYSLVGAPPSGPSIPKP